MTFSKYLCRVVGEHPAEAARFHRSSVQRMTAFAIAIHIPVFLWFMTGYLIASRIFNLETTHSLLVAAICAALVYMVERLVLATPKSWKVSIGRVVIGVVISILGATTVDLVIFDREIAEQLRSEEIVRIKTEGDAASARQGQVVATKKADWVKMQESAICEANGTCGSKTRNVGPVYRELARQAEVLRLDFLAAEAELAQIKGAAAKKLEHARTDPSTLASAGLLKRVEALHQYIQQNTYARYAWILFFTLVLFFELMVVLAKWVFGETVDDELNQIRERVSLKKGQDYLDATFSPLAGARSLLDAAYR